MNERLIQVTQQMNRNPTYNMSLLMETLTPSVIIPEMDKYYVFVYKAKTPNIQYDRHPFVVCTGIYKWGFTGYNFHWENFRRYSWGEVRSNLYEVQDDEINLIERAPIAKFEST